MFRNKEKHCRKCGQAGHNRRTCGKLLRQQIATPTPPTPIDTPTPLVNPHMANNEGGTIFDAYKTFAATPEPSTSDDLEPFDSTNTYGKEYSLNDLEVLWELSDDPASPLEHTPVEERMTYEYWTRFRRMYANMRDNYGNVVHPKVWVKFLEKISDMDPPPDDIEGLSETVISLDISLSYPKIGEQPGEGIFYHLMRSEKLYNKYLYSYAKSSSLPEYAMEQIKNSTDVRVLASLLQNRGGLPQRITEEIYARFAGDESQRVPLLIFQGILQNSYTSDEKFLQKVWQRVEKEHGIGFITEKEFTELQAMAIYNINFPYEQKIIHLKHPNDQVRAALSTQYKHLDSNLHELLHDKIPRVRESFIWNYQLSTEDKLEVLKILAQDEDKSIAATARTAFIKSSQGAMFFSSSTTVESSTT